MNILFLTFNDPRRVDYGGAQRTNVLWNGLKSVGEVWVVIPVAHKSLEFCDKEDKIFGLCLEKRYSIGWFAQRLLLKMFSRISVSWGITLSPISLLGVHFDVIVVRSLQLAARLNPSVIAPMLVDVDDTPTVDYELAYPSHRIRHRLLRYWQCKSCKKARVLWIPDAMQKLQLLPFRATFLPNIPLIKWHSCTQKTICEKKHFVLLFVGYFIHMPNRCAIEWFLKNYWKTLKSEIPGLILRIAGGGLPIEVQKDWLSYQDVEVLGYVDDLEGFYTTGDALIAPMQTGSGSCIKVLEAMSTGLPVIATHHGLRGIPCEDRKPENDIYPFENIKDLISGIKAIQAQCRLRNKQGGQDYIKRGYTQEAVNNIINDSIRATINGFGDK